MTQTNDAELDRQTPPTTSLVVPRHDLLQEVNETLAALLDAFRPERYTHLVLSALSFLALMYAVYSYVQTPGHEDRYPEVFGMFGSAGVIGYSVTRVLHMWTRSVQIVEKVILSRVK